MKLIFALCMAFSWQFTLAQTQEAGRENFWKDYLYFDFGSAELRPEADSILKRIVEKYHSKEHVSIRITAHTDSIGSIENNLKLSERRAQAVKTELFNRGIPSDSITADVFGETKPIALNDSEKGRQRNRRATIELSSSQPLLKLEGWVRDQSTLHGLESMVVVRTRLSKDTFFTDTTGYFSHLFPPETIVGIDAFATCYFFKTEMVKLTKTSTTVQVDLASAKAGQKIALDNLYFLGGLPVLLEKSKPELPKILKFLQTNPQLKIEIAGHVNVPNTPPISTSNESFLLSVQRARVVHDFLLENGIQADRISYKGYGNWEMVYPNASSQKEMALNRRVEMRILEGNCN